MLSFLLVVLLGLASFTVSAAEENTSEVENVLVTASRKQQTVENLSTAVSVVTKAEILEKNITLYSTCEHHLLPIVGKAHIAYISNGTVVGLSKMNRIVDYYAKRPQVQERLTLQIVKELQEVLNTDDVACVIDAKHLCVNSRGIRDIDSSTVTSEFGGKFKNQDSRREFLDYIKFDTQF